MELREKTLSQWHFNRRKSHTEQLGIEAGSPWQAYYLLDYEVKFKASSNRLNEGSSCRSQNHKRAERSDSGTLEGREAPLLLTVNKFILHQATKTPVVQV